MVLQTLPLSVKNSNDITVYLHLYSKNVIRELSWENYYENEDRDQHGGCLPPITP